MAKTTAGGGPDFDPRRGCKGGREEVGASENTKTTILLRDKE